jgi:arabinogalactan endo-1,4-beta-galactosidase
MLTAQDLCILAVFDNGGKTFDRYTVVFEGVLEHSGSYEMLGLSYNPDWPQGFSQWSECVYNSADDNSHLGSPIAWEALPEHIREHIRTRLRDAD